MTSLIPGLRYIPDYISRDEESFLLEVVDYEPWITDLKRRVQHYGYRYDYRSRSVDPDMYLGPLPDWALVIAQRLYRQKFIERAPDQLIVNEYEPGQGIAAHVDCIPCFDDTIVSISLGSACVMEFEHTQTRRKECLLLEAGSLLIMRGEARYDWKHGIPARKTDTFKGQKIRRGLRVSMTFRNVILPTSSLHRVKPELMMA